MGEETFHLNVKRVAKRTINELIGLIKGLLADNVLNDTEIEFLAKWIIDNHKNCQSYPFDVLYNRIQLILEDGIIDDIERQEMFELLESITGKNIIVEDKLITTSTTLPLTSPCPPIIFKNKVFCFTGTFAYGQRKDCHAVTLAKSAIISDRVVKDLDYLVIGTKETRDWRHSSFGAKIVKCQDYNTKYNRNIAIISEDSWIEAILQADNKDKTDIK